VRVAGGGVDPDAGTARRGFALCACEPGVQPATRIVTAAHDAISTRADRCATATSGMSIE